jgi:polyisoprenyl-phosphate glycosyltransferase
MRAPTALSVVVPVFGEGGNLERLTERLKEVTATIAGTSWEFIFVNDGSTDNTLEILNRLAAADARIKVVDLSRNFGKELALTAGLNFARGEAVIFMDADLQHPPEMLEQMVGHWRSGAEVVVGIRRSSSRQALFRRIGSRAYGWFMAKISEIQYLDGMTDFCLADRKVVEAFKTIGERRRIFRGLIEWLGFRRVYFEFDAPDRHAGKPRYSGGKLLELAVDSFISHSSFPLRLVGYLGIAIMVSSAGALAWMWYAPIFISSRWLYTSLAKVMVFNTMLIGLILTALGIMAIYVAKIHAEVVSRPLFTVRGLLNIEAPAPRAHGYHRRESDHDAAPGEPQQNLPRRP